MLERRQAKLEYLEETNVAEANGRLAMLRQSPAGGGDVEFIDQLIQNLETKDAMVDGGLEELGNVVG